MPTIKLTADDYLSASKLHSELNWKQSIIFSAMIVVGMAAYFLPLHGLAPSLVSGALIGGVIGGLGARFILLHLVMPRRARRIFAQQKSLHGEIDYQWDDDALTIKTERAQARMLWSDYIKWRENERLFVLYQSDIVFNLVPKRLFSDASQRDDFHRILATRIAPKKSQSLR